MDCGAVTLNAPRIWRFTMFRMNGMRHLVFSVLTAIILAAAGAFAANNEPYIQLTRISFIDGDVGYQRVPDEEWAAVSVNMPLEPGDRIYTGRNGRVEIEFEEGSVLRLTENTDIEFLSLDEDFVQIRMLLGVASITVEKNVAFEIATPAAAFTAEKSGIYRFEVAENGRSDAIVRKGRLEAVNNNFTSDITSGDIISVHPDGTRPVVTAYNRRDAWDEWTDRRDADRKSTSAVRRYVPDSVSIGVTELDRNGRWVYVTNYGWGWIPHSITSGWSPYSVGRWVYRARFGWTWISYETWGWLPYHYGRWYRDNRVGWVWIPGESVAFRFWSPGLVVFYRGSGWVSWGPLGPGDYYDAAYYHYRRIYAVDLARVRLLVTRQPGNYINRNARGAFLTVSIDVFRGINSAGHNANARRNDINQPWRQGNLVRGGLDIGPARESFRPAPDRRAERPRAEINRPVVVRHPPSHVSENNGRFTPINNPRVSPKPERPTASKPAPAQENRRPERPNSGSPARPNNTEPSSSSNPADGNREQPAVSNPAPAVSSPAPAVSNRAPAQENRQPEKPNTVNPARPNNTEPSSSRNPADGNRERPAASKPAPSASKPVPAQENRRTERPNTDNSSSSSARSTRESGTSANGGSSSENSNRSADPVQRRQSTLGVPSARPK